MANRQLRIVRISLGLLTGLFLWLLWQASTTTTPELESIKLRYHIAEAFFGRPNPAGTLEYTVIPNWRGLFPLAILFGVLFAILKPLPRFIALFSLILLGMGVGIYSFQVFKFIIPLGGPAIVLCCCYLCGTLIHLETEKIERNRELAVDLQMQAEQERQRIAKDLHDESLPSLSRVMRLADQLQKTYGDDPVPQQIRENLEGTIAEMRRVINDLHPSVLDELGLQPALQHLGSQLARSSGIDVTVNVAASEPSLSSFQQLCIYRIAQEAFTNIEKHAQATIAHVDLSSNAKALRLTIADNGSGTVPRSKPDSHGLRNIAHRAKLMGAKVEWTKPDCFPAGTMLILQVPTGDAS